MSAATAGLGLLLPTLTAEICRTTAPYGDGTPWETMDPATATFEVTDDAPEQPAQNTLVTFSKKPPVGASSVYLIGYHNKSRPVALQSQKVWLVDNPPTAPPGA